MSHRDNERQPPAQPYDGYHKYDQTVARDYEKTRETERHWQQEDAFIKARLRGQKIGSLLDLPVGTGRFFPHYSGVRHLTGVDISEDMLQEARRRVTIRPPDTLTELELGDVLALRFADGQFDMAIVCRLFHLLPPELLPKATAEICRVTNREIILQTYPTVAFSRLAQWRSRARALPRRALNKLLAVKPAAPAAAKPWSHIQSHTHNQAQIDAGFGGQGFAVALSKALSPYEGGGVRMTVYVRQ